MYCDHVGDLTIDHVDAVMLVGKKNGSANLVTCCLSCNSRKQAKSLEEFLGDRFFEVLLRIAESCEKPLDRRVGRLLASRCSARAVSKKKLAVSST